MKKERTMKKTNIKRIVSFSVTFFLFIIGITTFVRSYSEFVTTIQRNNSGIVDNIVYVNDADSDLSYYLGLNYTYTTDATLPTGTKQNFYTESNLVETRVLYSGTDINNSLVGYVSNTERQNTYIYYKYYPVNTNGTSSTSDDYILIELLDNPFSDRPTNKAFNGWYTNYTGAETSYDNVYYLRYAKVPVTYTNGRPDAIDISFNASWVDATVAYVNTSNNTWTNAINALKTKHMEKVNTHEKVALPFDMTGYYYQVSVSWYNSCNGYYNNNGVFQTNCTCTSWRGCTYYRLIENENLNTANINNYFRLNGTMQHITLDDLPLEYQTNYLNGYSQNFIMAGYYKKVHRNSGQSVAGLYNNNGDIQTGNSSSSNTDYYELLQYRDSNNELTHIDEDSEYYYLVTRDTNIVVLNANISSVWGSSATKPFTFTALNNGSNTGYRWDVGNLAVRLYSDVRIDQMTINSGQTKRSTNPPTSNNTSRTLYGNGYNLKVGRGIRQYNGNGTFASVVGGTNSTMGSSRTSLKKYKIVLESGVYNAVSLTNGASTGTNGSNHYLEMIGVYGNDYDRVSNNGGNNNSNLDVYYCASGSWGGNFYASTNEGITFDLTVKSGTFGDYKSDNTNGIYVGGRYGGVHYTSRRAKIEGGYIYNLIGGPLSANNRASINDSYIYVTGGEVDLIIGGAGQTATYGNRIIQVTGGTINYSVFGGSNGSDGSEGDGTVNGSSFIYIGGSAVIGKREYVEGNNKLFGAEAGSVFGIGNGKTGSSTIGSSDNSHIIIADNAVVRNSVYGGGNFGATGVSSTSNTTTSKIDILSGTINGNVYGGGNQNGSGSSSKLSTITINMYGGTVNGSIYGGSNESGTVYGEVNINVKGGTVSNVYGGGKGGVSNNNNGTFVSRTVNVAIGDNSYSTTPTITGNVYGGSAFGTVNGSSNSNSISSYGTNVKVYKGNINGSVFGGAEGDNSHTPYVLGNVLVEINGGTIGSVYGGCDAKGTPNGTIEVNINGGSVTNTFGGGNLAPINTSVVHLNGGTSTYVYGGGNLANANTTNVYLQGGSATSIFGGSNQSGNVTTANVTATNGTATNLYGGNNLGGATTNSVVSVSGGTIGDVYGGGNLATTAQTTLTLSGGGITNAYGGGNQAGITTSTSLTLSGSNIGSVYGGSNQSGDVPQSTIVATNGTIGSIYGGNNLGGSTTATNITVSGGTITDVYGGGNEAETSTTTLLFNGGSITNVYGGGNLAPVNTTSLTFNNGTATHLYGGGNLATANTTTLVLHGGNITNAYGGGNQAGITTSTSLTLSGSNIGSVYGGSNQSGDVPVSTINASSGTIGAMYGGNNLGGSTTTTNITVTGGTITDIYGGGNAADSTTSNVSLSGAQITNVYGGGNQASVDDANITIGNGVRIGNVFGGSNMLGTVLESEINIPFSSTAPIISNIYGGNNQGGETEVANITINCGTIGNVYGGGNYAVTGSTNTTINRANITYSVFGGGNSAAVTNDSILKINNARVNENVYGGGNLGIIGGNTNVTVTDSILGSSLFAGGNGYTAVVHGNTLLNVDGNTTVTHHVFGGGNAAPTGTEENNDSTAVVNIAGLTCGGNVYGGANTSVIYGTVSVNIGKNSISNTLNYGNINIGGTVFGGGEANASGSEIYDFSFISVTGGITININGQGHSTFNIDGSIFGSGNASSSSGYSNIYIKNYGTEANYKRNVSIQRADLVTLTNSVIELAGATDRTNEYSDVLFSLSRLDEIKLLNNSILYLETGTNLVKKFTSGLVTNNTEYKATVTIEDGEVTRNVNNKLYIYEGKNVNIATNENVTAYGEVSGMTFFGMYTHDRDDRVDTAFYKTTYDGDSVVPSSEIVHFTKGSYVLGLHHENHNYEQDGFYSNFPREDTIDRIDIKYIVPTPEDSNYYIWAIGEQITSYEITLTASKYSTLGTYELPLINFSEANTVFSVLGFNYNDLESGIELVDRSEIPRLASSGSIADSKMSLVMKSSDNGWITIGKTTFLSNESYFSGTTNYVGDNSTVVPTFLFYLYHSKNLENSGDMGSVTISLVAIKAIDDLTNEVKRVNIIVNLNRAIYTTNDYEGTITEGKKYEMFAPSSVNITAKSAFTSYYSLFVESDETIYRSGYHRVLASTYNFPANTKITMIDLLSGETPEYYYYVVTDTDYQNGITELATHGDVSYNLSKFLKMGSSNANNHYDDATKNALYYNSTYHVAEEEFLFIVDFKEAGITQDVIEKSLLLELRSSDNEVILSVIGVEQQQLFYNLYANKDSIIDVDASMSSTNVYIGDSVDVNINTNLVQQVANSNTIIDTNFFNYKSGIKVSILDSNNNVVNGPSIMGLSYTIGNTTYYPRFDGTVRINIAERIANVSTRMVINTENSNLASGNYKLLVESFASPDGIYYGLTSSDSVEIPFVVKNTIYGLVVVTNDADMVVDKTTGINDNNTNTATFEVSYSSGLTNPNIRVSLYRRDYSEVYSLNYDLVDLKDYFSDNLSGTNIENVYMLFSTPTNYMTTVLHLKDNLTSGTYKVMFSLYDGDTFIGEYHKYMVIK